MSVLFYSNDLSQASVLWMRRMLEGLGDDVTTLVTEVDPGPERRRSYEVAVLSDSFWRRWWRLSYRLGLTPGIRKTAKAIEAFTAAVASDRVSVVLAHYLTDGIKYDRVWQRTEKPVFIHCHGYDVTWDFRLHHDPHKPAHDADYPERVRALPEHVHFIANSRRTARRLGEIGIAQDRIHLKYLGVPISPSPPAPRGGGALDILYLGRLIDFKGPELVIRAFELASERGLRGRLLIAGDGPLWEECVSARDRSRCGERIELLGAVDAETGMRLRAAADIFTAHNRLGPISRQEEAFGVSYVEAMADGLPVVTGRNGSLPEVVEDGEQGILFEPGDVEAHAEAFLRLEADPELRAQMGRSGWQRVRDHFSIDRELRRLRGILGLDGSRR